jgi:hypothetical protein
MIKRLGLILTLCLFAVTAMADPRDRDVLLTSDGTLYTVETAANNSARPGESSWYLTLTTQNAGRSQTVAIPASLIGGAHSNPALGYDAESKTLFLLWQQATNGGLSSNLLFASYNDEQWSEPATLDAVDWDLRRNLKIAVTRLIEAGDREGKRVLLPQLAVHAVWWQESGMGEWARYAMLPIERGQVVTSEIQIRALPEFAGLAIERAPLRSMSPNELLRHPAIVTNPTKDSVDVVFGHTQNDSLHRVRIKPVNDGRLRIPIGVKDANLGRPKINVNSSGVEAVIDGENIALYAAEKNAMAFVLFRNGGWSESRSVVINDKLSTATAVSALRDLVARE